MAGHRRGGTATTGFAYRPIRFNTRPGGDNAALPATPPGVFGRGERIGNQGLEGVGGFGRLLDSDFEPGQTFAHVLAEDRQGLLHRVHPASVDRRIDLQRARYGLIC